MALRKKNRTLSDQIRDIISEFTEKSNMSIHRLSIESKIDHRTIRRFMSGESITASNIDAIADYLNLDIVQRKPKR